MQEDKKVSGRELFTIFFKAGLAFGGGLGILAVLERELLTRRQAVGREEFLATYALGRIVPSGTMTALAVAYGYRFAGWAGTALALLGLTLPAVLIILALTAAYVWLKDSALLAVLPYTLLPAALAFVAAAAYKLSRPLWRPGLEAVLAAAAFLAVLLLGFNPALVLLAGGLAGALIWGKPWGGSRPEPQNSGHETAP